MIENKNGPFKIRYGPELEWLVGRAHRLFAYIFELSHSCKVIETKWRGSTREQQLQVVSLRIVIITTTSMKIK